MPIIAKAGPSFTPTPAGVHVSICCDVVDLGVLEVNYAGKSKKQHKIKIVWQIAEDQQDGRPFLCQKRYTLSLHEKAGLRKDLESWRGRAFTETELNGFDVESIVGVGCLLNVIHENKSGSLYANVTAIMRLPKNTQPPSIRDYVRVIDRDPSNQAQPDQPWNPEITDDDVPF